MGRNAQLALVTACAAALAGCTTSGNNGTSAAKNPSSSNTMLAGAEHDPIRPVSLRIHPLTHTDTTAGGKADQCAIIVHFELKDRFGDSVKSTGLLRIELAKPASGALTGMESRELTWELPELIDAHENFKRVDSSTRTYRIALNAPAWVCEMTSKKAPRDASKWVKIRVSMEVPGQERALRDEYVIQ